MRVIVNLDRCDSNGRCVAAAPEVFELDDDDDLHVLQENPPEDLRVRVVEAERACPKDAITVEY
jgi:ferredoxin